MGILEELSNPTFKVTKSDKILIEYIKNTLNTVVYKPISEIAKESGIGEATVTRFTKKLGYSGFQEFKINLTKELTLQEEKVIINPNISCNEEVTETAMKLFQATSEVLHQTLEKINPHMIVQCVQMLTKARKIYIIGIGYSGIVATDFNYKLMRIGANSFPIIDSHTMLMLASIMHQDDIILAISHSGNTDEVIETVHLAKQQGAKIIALTENYNSPLLQVADVFLTYQSNETTFETGSVTSKLAQMFMLDLIYTEMIKEQFDDVLEKKVKTTDVIVAYKNKRKKN